ncbi:MAG: T9SS type A sorting domain-containing protein [Rhodothermaceae bacterium]|nr:T9SS type A sorting domain-containing protein [Rhodothermaceae bacterium]
MRALRVFAGLFVIALLGILYIRHQDAPPPLPEAPTNTPEARARWEFERTKDPVTGKMPPGIKSGELAFARELAKQSIASKTQATLTWSQMGPDTLGGRTRALAIDVTDGNTILAGAVSGGIWKSTDGGASWSQTMTPTQLLSVTTIAQDTRTGQEDTWYAGTGEYTGNSTSATGATFFGDGIYKSTDGGDSWTLLSSTSTGVPQSFDNLYDFVWRVATDPSNGSQEEVYAAAIWGIFRSVDGGSSWTQVLSSTNTYHTDVVVSSTGVVYAALGEPGTNAGIWRSADGVTWTDITPGGWSSNTTRTALALAPSNEDILYTISYTSGDGTHDTSIWKYTHSTTTWEDRSANVPSFGGFQDGNFDSQGGYDLHVAVKPDNQNTVYIGGTSLYRSTDGFASTSNIDWIAGYSFGTDNWSGTHHADQHIAIFSNSDADVMYTGSDGGVHRTDDVTAATVHWVSLNRGYLSGQFYSVGIDHTSTTNMALMGGTQDNGTWYVGDPGSSTLGEEIWGGDGAFVANLNDGDLRYASFQNGQIYRLTYSSNVRTSWAYVSTSMASSYSFIHPYTLDPNDSDIMYLPGGDRMYRNSSLTSIPNYTSSAHTIGWQELSNTVISGGGVISAVMASESNPDHRMYYGTSTGRVYVLDNADTGDPSPTDITGGSFPSNANVSSITVHPDDADRVMVTFSNYFVQSIWYSDDGGSSWTDVSGSLEENTDGSGNGPSVRWAKMGVISGSSTQYFVGTSTGLYSTTTLNGTSTSWTQEGASTIGNVVIDMIDIRDSDGYIAVGTHGNGFYTSTLNRPTPTAGPGGVTDNLELWLKADTGITESSNDVTAWADQSGNNYNFSDAGTAEYTYDDDGLNYNPEIINSDGSNRRLQNTTSITLQTVVLVTDPDNPDVSDNAFSEVGANDEGIRADASTSTNWDVPGASEDFTATSGQGWLNGTSGTDPAHANSPNILVVEAPSAATLSGGIELGDTESNRFWHGSIAEVIGYNGTLSTSDREMVQTYLAIKYGIHLSSNYVASDATTLWNATTNSTYHNDVTGIGRDDNSELDQKQSTSQSGGIVEIGLGALAVDNASNANSFSADGSFLMWGHDNASSSVGTSFSGTNVLTRMARIWTVEETGTVGTVEVQIPSSYGATYLVVSNNSSLTSPTEYALTNNGDGTHSTTVNFSDGQFFTFGSDTAPGGVAANLVMWFKSDEGVYSNSSCTTALTNSDTADALGCWVDQSANATVTTQSSSGPRPDHNTAGQNYNPTFAFDESEDDLLDFSSFPISSPTDIHAYYVIDENDGDGDEYIISSTAGSNNRFYLKSTTAGFGAAPSNTATPASSFYLATADYDLGTTTMNFSVDAGTPISASQTWSNTLSSPYKLGAYGSSDGRNNHQFNGHIAEIIIYNADHSGGSDEQKIQSYLGLKWGLSLPIDYLASDGTTLWNATTNSTYHNGVAGIGRDDASTLYQKQSDSDRLTLALGSLAANNASNSNTFSTDLSFLILGHDNGSLTEGSVTISSETGQLLGRTWFAEEINETGTLEIQVDFSSLSITGTEARDFYLVLDTNSDPTDGYRELIAASSFASDIATFTNVDIEDGDYVMILTSFEAGKTDPPLTDGQGADGVLGQSTFSSSRADNGGVSASSTDGPSYVAVGPTGKLFASDTDNNRVLRWASVAAASNGATAEAVLGQASFSASAANRGGSVAANTMYEPHGVYVTSSGALYVADTRNNRVLRFDNAESASSGASADAVLGQADFTSNDANRGSTAAANTLRWPMDLHVDGSGNLWVADWLNHRVLRFDNVAAKSDGASADGVLGQDALTTSLRMWKDNTDADSFVFPSGVCVDDDGVLWVADTGNSRILRFDNASGKADGADADGVLGQPDFTSWQTTRGTGSPAANTLQWPEGGLDVDQNGRLWVADRWGDRVLWYHNAASKSNGADADGLIGQGSFTSRNGSVNSSTFNSVTDVLVDESNDYVWVVDNNHNRILRFDGSDLALGKTNTLAVDEMMDFWLIAGKHAYANQEVTQLATQDDDVHVWLDQSRHQFTALSDSPPVFVENAINGYPAIEFGAANARMRIEGGLFGEANLDNATVWAVIKDERALSEDSGFFLSMQSRQSTSSTTPGKNINTQVEASTHSIATNLFLGDITFTSGTVAELMATFKTPSDNESRMFASYLAIKYGLSFEQNYISATGDTLWDQSLHEKYSTGIAGIGRSDDLGLMHAISKAAGKNQILTLRKPLVYSDSLNAEQAFEFDQTYTLWGHNDGSLSIEEPTHHINAAYRMGRTWYVRETGAVDSLQVRIPAGTKAEYLLIDATDAFSNPEIIRLVYSQDSKELVAHIDIKESGFLTFASSTPYAGYGEPPKELVLYQNYPNPFNPSTTLRFDLPQEAHTSLEIFDILGRRIQVLINDEMPAGSHSITFNAAGLASGVYFYRIRVNDEVQTLKMLLAK